MVILRYDTSHIDLHQYVMLFFIINIKSVWNYRDMIKHKILNQRDPSEMTYSRYSTFIVTTSEIVHSWYFTFIGIRLKLHIPDTPPTISSNRHFWKLVMPIFSLSSIAADGLITISVGWHGSSFQKLYRPKILQWAYTSLDSALQNK